MVKYNTKVLGFGDNVVDLYEHSHMMYPGGNCVNLCAYSKMFEMCIRDRSWISHLRTIWEPMCSLSHPS